MTVQNRRHLTNRSAVAATLGLLAFGAHAAPVTIDFDAIPPADLPFIQAIDFPANVTEDGFTLTPGGGDLEVWNAERGFGALPGFSSPNYIRPAVSPVANATLASVEADGSTFRFVGLDGRTAGPVDETGAPLARGSITVRGYANGSLAAQDVFDVTTGFDLSSGGTPGEPGTVVPAVSAVAANLAGKAVDRLEIVLDGFDSDFQPSPNLYALADNIKLDTDATVLQTVTTDLVAGQRIPVGSVQISQDSATCTATVTLKTTYPWCITEAHLATGDTLGDIPQTRKGNPIPGQFAESAYPACEGEVAFENVAGGSLFAVHAVVYNTASGTDETAWGAGTAFPGKNWATYVALPVGCQNHQ